MTRLSFHDFVIIGPAEFDCSGSRGGFRAIRRSDRLPVLLHRFRPPGTLLDPMPRIRRTDPPDFSQPFLTRFTGVLQAGGSAYLVEPLPVCASLQSAWRAVLLNTAGRAVGFVGILVTQLILAVRAAARQHDNGGAVCSQNVVLTQAGTYGLLAACLESDGGRRWLRPVPPHCTSVDNTSPASRPAREAAALARVVEDLLETEQAMARARRSEILSPQQRDAIRTAAASAGSCLVLSPAGKVTRRR